MTEKQPYYLRTVFQNGEITKFSRSAAQDYFEKINKQTGMDRSTFGAITDIIVENTEEDIRVQLNEERAASGVRIPDGQFYAKIRAGVEQVMDNEERFTQAFRDGCAQHKAEKEQQEQQEFIDSASPEDLVVSCEDIGATEEMPKVKHKGGTLSLSK